MKVQTYYFKNLFQYPNIFWGILAAVFGFMLICFAISLVSDRVIAGIVLIVALLGFSRIITRLTNKLTVAVTITDTALGISMPETISIFSAKRVAETIKWKEIVSVEIRDKKQGTIRLTTRTATYSFGYADRHKMNEKLVSLINEKITEYV